MGLIEETKTEPKKEPLSLKSLKAEIDAFKTPSSAEPSNLESRLALIEKQIQTIANSCGLKNRLPREV